VVTVLAACAALGCSAQGAARAATEAGAPASQVSLLAEPQTGVAPFLTLIAAARTSIDLTMYKLSDRQVERALSAAAARGVNVRVVLNGGYYSKHETTNAAAYRYLSGHGVQVRYSPTYFALTHQKTLTVDGREAVVMTLNFDGLYATTRDYAVLDRQPADVATILAAFNADYAARRTMVSAGTGDLVWSPRAAATVLGLIDSARRSLDLENEEMAYAPARDALCSVARRGVIVRVVMTYASGWRRDFGQLRDCGVSVRLYHGQRYYIHAKLLIVDGRRALVSSQNLSAGSLQYNRELGIILHAESLVDRLSADFAADYAGAGT
jgi:phosphatidylserine/phosphatidylglycerophosphate/cardiolipin synthase-like enzyme